MTIFFGLRFLSILMAMPVLSMTLMAAASASMAEFSYAQTGDTSCILHSMRFRTRRRCTSAVATRRLPSPISSVTSRPSPRLIGSVGKTAVVLFFPGMIN